MFYFVIVGKGTYRPGWRSLQHSVGFSDGACFLWGGAAPLPSGAQPFLRQFDGSTGRNTPAVTPHFLRMLEVWRIYKAIYNRYFSSFGRHNGSFIFISPPSTFRVVQPVRAFQVQRCSLEVYRDALHVFFPTLIHNIIVMLK